MKYIAELCKVMRKSNILAEQVAHLMAEDGKCAATWGGRVVQRWLEPTLRLLVAVRHNAEGAAVVLGHKIDRLKIDTSKAENRKRKRSPHQPTTDSATQTKRKSQLKRFESIHTELCSVLFHIFAATL